MYCWRCSHVLCHRPSERLLASVHSVSTLPRLPDASLARSFSLPPSTLVLILSLAPSTACPTPLPCSYAVAVRMGELIEEVSLVGASA